MLIYKINNVIACSGKKELGDRGFEIRSCYCGMKAAGMKETIIGNFCAGHRFHRTSL